MNAPHKKLLVGFTIFSCAILLSATGIIAYAVYQVRLSSGGDVFDRVAANFQFNWIAPTLVALAGLFITGIVAVIGFWRVYPETSKADRA